MLPADQLAQRYLERHPEAAAEMMTGLAPAEVAAALGALEMATVLVLATHLPALNLARCLEHLSRERGAAILAGLPRREAVEVLHRTDAAAREHYLRALPERTAHALRAGLGRLQDSVAALMDSHVRGFPVDMNVTHALAVLEQEPEDQGCHLYLTDAQGRFSGALPLRTLYTSHPHSRLSSLACLSMATLPEGARSSSVIGHPAWLRYPQLPVVDAGGRFVGVLRRERLTSQASQPAVTGTGPLGMALAFLESYATGNALLLELLMRGGGRRD